MAHDHTHHPLLEYVLERLEPGETVYAVVDAARDNNLATAAREDYGLQTRSLFSGALAGELEHVAPHLVRVDLDSGYLAKWEAHFGRSAGILLVCTADMDSLWTHLRSVLTVTDESDQEYTFRYYDPRVLRAFLPSCKPKEARELYGPVRRILMEADQWRTMLCCDIGMMSVKIDSNELRGPACPDAA